MVIQLIQQYIMRRFIYALTLLLIGVFCFSQSRYISVTTKRVVFARDAGVCQCCGSSQDLEYDHVIPFSCGGNSKSSNIQLLCKKCNRSKSNSCFCKIHHKQIGNNCCDRKSLGTKSLKGSSDLKLKSTDSSQCIGTTKKGNRCKKKTTNSNGRCSLH